MKWNSSIENRCESDDSQTYTLKIDDDNYGYPLTESVPYTMKNGTIFGRAYPAYWCLEKHPFTER